jgi:hypothetical protein
MTNLSTKKIGKVVLGLTAVCVLLLALSCITWADDRITRDLQKFTDVPESHWANLYITRLVFENAIKGYPDGTFGPSRNITRAEFVTVVLGALLDSKPEEPPAGQHWATNYIKSAEKNNLLEVGEFAADTWNTPITRQEMAKIMARGAQYVRKEALEEKTSVYTSKITDFTSIPEGYLSYVAQVYAKGIVTGYPDGSFGGGKQATRAEAAAMVVRLIDKSQRVKVSAAPDVPAGNQIAFNPAVDVAADGRMKLEKAEEYLMKNLQSLKFYEENGKVYFEGYVTEVPEGYRNRINIIIVFMPGTGLTASSYNSDPFPADIVLPPAGSFKEEVKGSLEQINYIEVTMSINAIKHTNKVYGRDSYEVAWIFSSGHDNRIDAINCIKADEETSKFYDLSQIFQW